MKRPARARTFCGNLLLNPRGTSRRQVRFAPHPDGVRTRRRLCHTPSRVTRKQQAGLVPHTSQRSNGRPLVFRVSRRRWLASCCWPRPRPPRRRSSSRLSRACARCRRGRRAWRLARDLELSVLTRGQNRRWSSLSSLLSSQLRGLCQLHEPDAGLDSPHVHVVSGVRTCASHPLNQVHARCCCASTSLLRAQYPASRRIVESQDNPERDPILFWTNGGRASAAREAGGRARPPTHPPAVPTLPAPRSWVLGALWDGV